MIKVTRREREKKEGYAIMEERVKYQKERKTRTKSKGKEIERWETYQKRDEKGREKDS